jgi:hypothetical protein
MRSKPNQVLHFFFGTTFLAIVNVMSIVGFIVLFVTNKTQAIVALVMFVVFLIIILLRVFWVTDQFLKNKSRIGYDKLSTSAKYHTRDGRMITYEVVKFIQCKQILTQRHEHIFYWSGSTLPTITSDTMTFEKVVDDDDGFKKAIFRFKTPLVYNGVFIAHIRMQLDDTDRRSSTHIEQYIKDPMQLVSFNVQLLYKRGNVPDARLLRRPIGATSIPHEPIDAVPFDKKTFSYLRDVYDPEVGYTYRLEWTR